MAVYNSYNELNQKDSDITIINPSTMDDNDENPTNTQSSTTEKIPKTSTHHYDGKSHDYVFVDHNPQEMAKQLEQTLKFYIQDLKQESNTQLNCDQQLIIRLMNLIRPAYSTDQKKMIELDEVLKEIASLHDKRHIEQLEKLNSLRTEVSHLNRMLLLTKNDQICHNENNPTYSMPSTNNQLQPMIDYDRLTEIEDDAIKLHAIVQTQRNQINEIISLMSQADSKPTSLNQTDVPLDENSNDASTEKPTTKPPGQSLMSTLVDKIKKITTHSEKPTETKLENHSPDTSPTESLSTLTLKSLKATTVDQQGPAEERKPDQPHQSIDIPLTPATVDQKKCPICNKEFSTIDDDMEIYEHIENCLFPTGVTTQQKDYECPNCNKKYPGTQEQTYLQHLSDCYNRSM